MENNNEEMDLIALLRWIFGGVKNVFRSCLHFCGAILKITYREKYIMLFFMLSGVALAIYTAYPKVYRGEYLVHSEFVNSYYLKTMVDALDRNSSLMGQDMAQLLGTSQREAASIENVKAYYVLENKKTGQVMSAVYKKKIEISDTNLIVSPTKICIRLYLNDLYTIEGFKDRQYNMLHFFRTSDEFKEQAKSGMTINANMLASVNSEIAKLDSLSRVDYFQTDAKRTRMQVSFDSTGVSLGEKDKRLYHDDILHLKNKRDSLNQKMEHADVSGIVNCSPIIVKKTPVNYLPKQLIIFCGIFYILALLTAVFWENRKSIKQYLEEK
ncbi:MAG: hypothetical protein E7076_06325 [Bacteroidales bacterium]|nr:hypothetical protein [Bacteroidales bacterium]